MDAQNAATYDPYNYAILSGAKYAGAKVDVAGVQGFGAALKDGQGRALQQLQMAASLVKAAETAADVTFRIVNNTGHKMTSGFPEGRRIWLNVKFYNAAGVLVREENPYRPLVVTTDAQGGKYTLKATLSGTSYTDSSLTPGQTYCYAVAAYVTCADQTRQESGYSNIDCAIPTR